MYALITRFLSLIDKGNSKAKLLMVQTYDKGSEITSIRLKPDIRARVSAVRELLGVSFSQVGF